MRVNYHKITEINADNSCICLDKQPDTFNQDNTKMSLLKKGEILIIYCVLVYCLFTPGNGGIAFGGLMPPRRVLISFTFIVRFLYGSSLRYWNVKATTVGCWLNVNCPAGIFDSGSVLLNQNVNGCVRTYVNHSRTVAERIKPKDWFRIGSGLIWPWTDIILVQDWFGRRSVPAGWWHAVALRIVFSHKYE